MPTVANLKVVKRGKKYELLEDFLYSINGYIITVPKTFLTDFASVPKAFQVLVHKTGKHSEAAVVHDYLYSRINNTGINRTLADKIFLYIMEECGVSFLKRTSMYLSVRTFGSIFYLPKISNEGYRDKALIDRTDEAIAYYEHWKSILKF